ncbi:NAD(P)-binding domain-containing protein [Streptomyces sp. 5-10]|uniref:NAD(P)-binding domain-containing protein n=1 Tax=Streptomyces sp. 5-10 TaxID=878925 RepID=UPI001CC2B4E4
MTSEPATSASLSSLAADQGAAFVDAPVSGGRDGARGRSADRLRRCHGAGPRHGQACPRGPDRRPVPASRRPRPRLRQCGQAAQQRPGSGQPGLGRRSGTPRPRWRWHRWSVSSNVGYLVTLT